MCKSPCATRGFSYFGAGDKFQRIFSGAYFYVLFDAGFHENPEIPLSLTLISKVKCQRKKLSVRENEISFREKLLSVRDDFSLPQSFFCILRSVGCKWDFLIIIF